MPKILQETIDEIESRADIVEVAQRLFPDLKKKGANYFACSPLTGEKTASLCVNPAKQNFNDYSAGKFGRVIYMVMLYSSEKPEFQDAVKYLADMYGIRIRYERTKSKTPSEKRTRKEELHDILDWAMRQYRFWFSQEKNTQARDYLLAKGFTQETIDRYQIGYSPDSYNTLLRAAYREFLPGYRELSQAKWKLKNATSDKDKQQAQIELDQITLRVQPEIDKHRPALHALLVEATLISRARDNDTHYYDFFRHRIMFPIFNESGNVAGFTARILPDGQTTKGEQPKYVNSHSSVAYTKESLFFGLYQNRKSIRKLNEAIIVEGPTDVMAMTQEGFANCVATCGTAFTQKHLMHLARYTTNFVALFDGDAAGQRANENGIKILLNPGGRVRVGLIPDKLDPFDLVMMKGSAAMQRVLDEAVDFIEYKIGSVKAYKPPTTKPDKPEDPQKTMKRIQDVVNTICYIDNAILREVYFQRASDLTQIPLSIIKKEADRMVAFRTNAESKLVNAIERTRQPHPNPDEQALLRALLRFMNMPMLDGRRFLDVFVGILDNHDFEFSATEDAFLFFIICCLRDRDTVTYQAIKEKSPRAHYHATQLFDPASEFQYSEMLGKKLKTPELTRVTTLVLQEAVQNYIYMFNEQASVGNKTAPDTIRRLEKVKALNTELLASLETSPQPVQEG